MAITCLDGTALDERIIKVGIDPGFKQGRQYGRGMSGGQVKTCFAFVCVHVCFVFNDSGHSLLCCEMCAKAVNIYYLVCRAQNRQWLPRTVKRQVSRLYAFLVFLKNQRTFCFFVCFLGGGEELAIKYTSRRKASIID